MPDKPHILIVDDEPNVLRVLGALLEKRGYVTSRASSGEEALALVRAQDPDLVVTDLRMPGIDGLQLLQRMRESFQEIPVVLLTAHGTIEAAVEAMKWGAHDFLTKPFDNRRVVEVIGQTLAQSRRFRTEFQGPLSGESDCGIIGRSAAMEEIRALLRRVAPTPSTLLITGETGCGKELVAHAVHRLSDRARGPLVRINCGALPENLVESELFGHERGAFTSAHQAKPGRFELADGGTLFLDEIGELPLSAQATLLRVVEDGRVDRVGSTQSRTVDVRLVAATNRDLETEVRLGRFRRDLHYRLRVVELRLPALRERPDDIPPLVEFFLDKHSNRLRRPRPRISGEALAWLGTRHWEGNVRELENAVERAVLLAAGPELGPADFGAAKPGDGRPGGDPGEISGIKTAAQAAAESAERRLIRAALDATGGNVTRAAEKLGLSRRGLQLKMKMYGLQREPTGL